MITLILGIALILIGIADWSGAFEITTLSLFGCVVSALFFVIFDFLKEITANKKIGTVYFLAQIAVVVSLVIFPYITEPYPRLLKANDALSLIGLGIVIITIAYRDRSFITNIIIDFMGLSKTILKEKAANSKRSLAQMEKLNETWKNTLKEMEDLHKQEKEKLENSWKKEMDNISNRHRELLEEVNSSWKNIVHEISANHEQQLKDVDVSLREKVQEFVDIYEKKLENLKKSIGEGSNKPNEVQTETTEEDHTKSNEDEK